MGIIHEVRNARKTAVMNVYIKQIACLNMLLMRTNIQWTKPCLKLSPTMLYRALSKVLLHEISPIVSFVLLNSKVREHTFQITRHPFLGHIECYRHYPSVIIKQRAYVWQSFCYYFRSCFCQVHVFSFQTIAFTFVRRVCRQPTFPHTYGHTDTTSRGQGERVWKWSEVKLIVGL